MMIPMDVIVDGIMRHLRFKENIALMTALSTTKTIALACDMLASDIFKMLEDNMARHLGTTSKSAMLYMQSCDNDVIAFFMTCSDKLNSVREITIMYNHNHGKKEDNGIKDKCPGTSQELSKRLYQILKSRNPNNARTTSLRCMLTSDYKLKLASHLDNNGRG